MRRRRSGSDPSGRDEEQERSEGSDPEVEPIDSGTIIALRDADPHTRARTLLRMQRLHGNDAVQMGNIVPVPKYNPSELPKEVVAEMRVVKVRKKVTIAVITRSSTDVFQGENVEMRVGF